MTEHKSDTPEMEGSSGSLQSENTSVSVTEDAVKSLLANVMKQQQEQEQQEAPLATEKEDVDYDNDESNSDGAESDLYSEEDKTSPIEKENIQTEAYDPLNDKENTEEEGESEVQNDNGADEIVNSEEKEEEGEDKDDEIDEDEDEEVAQEISSDEEQPEAAQEESDGKAEEDEEEEDSANDESQDDVIQPEKKSGSQDLYAPNSDDKSIETESTTLPVSDAKGDNVNYDLLQRQADYIMASDMLNLQEFKELNSDEKIVAILTMLNSNPETSMPRPSQEPVNTNVTNNSAHLESAKRRLHPRTDLSQPMTPIERQRYTEYLRGENRITEIQHFPPKSRLFIGNLPLKNVTKEDLFRIFSPYGHIFQINIKNAFGFIQYDDPQSVKDAIECESQELNFGKKLILEISSSNSRPQFDHGDHGTNSSSTFISSSKRPFAEEEEEEDMYSDNTHKKGKRRIPQCQIYVKRTADRSYANEVFGKFRQGTGLETDMIFLKPRMELRKMINDSAYDGVWGVVLVNKTRNVDIQTFYKGPQGETKFDEYISVSCDDAVAIFNNLKNSRTNGGSGMPQQQYYSGYNMQPQPQQAYMQQPPAMYGNAPPPPPPQSYVAPPMAQGYAGYPAQIPLPQQQQQQQQHQHQQHQHHQQQHQQQQPAQVVPPMPNGPMDQQQLLSAIQHLPPNVVSSLLSMAQQQPQPQQQQLIGLVQSMQNQQPHQQAVPSQSNPNPYQSYQQSPSQMSNTPPQQQQQPSGGNNVQSLLDSLAQLQK